MFRFLPYLALGLLTIACLSLRADETPKSDPLPFGQEIAGLSGRVSADRRTYTAGQFPILRFDLRNARPVRIQPDPWFGGSPYGGVFLETPSGEICPIEGPAARANAGRPEINLPAGATESATLDLIAARMSKMRKSNYADYLLWAMAQYGQFAVHFVYGDRDHRLWSNNLVFSIEPPGDDQPWSKPQDGLRLLTGITRTAQGELLVASFWNTTDKPLAVHPACVGWQLTDADRKDHVYYPLAAGREALKSFLRQEEIPPKLVDPSLWRTVAPKGKITVLVPLSFQNDDRIKPSGGHFLEIPLLGFTSAGAWPKPWSVAAAYQFDSAKEAFPAEAWKGTLVGNRVTVENERK